MPIRPFLKEIARGAQGTRALNRAQAEQLMGHILDGHCTDLQVGAFCVAMRVKGETADELAGFLNAIHPRLQRLPASSRPVIVLPSYNGARKLPVLTPLLALLLARAGWPVLLHGSPSEDNRVPSAAVLAALDVHPGHTHRPIAPGEVRLLPTAALNPALDGLLQTRRHLGLRGPAHSLVKLMNPIDGPALIVGSYTHPEFATLMADTHRLLGSHALLLRGTEGEPVADPRRSPRMDLILHGQPHTSVPAQSGSLNTLPDLPAQHDPASTAAYIRQVLAGTRCLPAPIAGQLALIQQACQSLHHPPPHTPT